MCRSINGKKSPTAQKIIGRRGKVKNAFSNFDVQQMTFDNINCTPRGNGSLKAVVKVRICGTLFAYYGYRI